MAFGHQLIKYNMRNIFFKKNQTQAVVQKVKIEYILYSLSLLYTKLGATKYDETKGGVTRNDLYNTSCMIRLI